VEHPIPAAEEKQILDAIKIVLENGYCISETEMLEIFDIVGLRALAETCNEGDMFIEFVRYVARVFEFREESFNEYFGIEVRKKEDEID